MQKAFFSCRSPLPKKIILFDLIQMFRRNGCISDEMLIVGEFNIRLLKDKLVSILYKAPLINIDLEELLKKFIGSCYDRYANISDVCAKDLEDVAGALVNRASEYAEKNEYFEVFKITRSVISTYIPLFDDCAILVNTLRFVDEAFKCLIELIDLDIDKSLRKEIFIFAEIGFNDAVEKGSVLDIDWLRLMAFAVNSNQEEAKFLQLIDQYRSTHFDLLDDEEDKALLGEKPLHLIYTMYERRKPKEVVKAFVESNLHDDTMRKLAIELALKDENLEKAENLCRQRIEIQEKSKDKFTQIFGWYDILLQIGKHSGNREIILEAAQILFEEHPKMEWYLLLKEHTAMEEWRLTRLGCVDLLFLNMKYRLLVEILCVEQDEKGMIRLMGQLTFSDWLQFENKLFEHWPNLVAEYFDRPVWYELKSRNSAEGAKAIVDFLRRVKEKIGEEKVNNVIALIKALYPRRRKLITALQGV